MENVFQICRWHGHFICDEIIRSLDFATVAYLRWMAKVKVGSSVMRVGNDTFGDPIFQNSLQN